MIAVNINTDPLIRQMNSLHDALLGAGQDASTLVQDEVKRLARMIVSFVPPLRSSGNPRQVGEQAVERDIKNLVSEATPNLIDEVGSRYGVRDIQTAWLTEKDGKQLNLKWDHLDPTGDRLEEYHRSYQDRNGRIPKVKPTSGVWSARVVAPVGTRQPLIDKNQKHVGHWKATWAKGGAALGDKYPTWINRHFNSPMAQVKIHLEGESPFVTFGSSAGGNDRIQSRIQGAVNARAKAMARRVKLILSGYSKDLSQKMKAQAKAKNWSEPLEAIE